MRKIVEKREKLNKFINLVKVTMDRLGWCYREKRAEKDDDNDEFATLRREEKERAFAPINSSVFIDWLPFDVYLLCTPGQRLICFTEKQTYLGLKSQKIYGCTAFSVDITNGNYGVMRAHKYCNKYARYKIATNA